MRAIVLGGGGVTGIAWEVGVLQGLREAGVGLAADVVLGTSAGSFVGTALASGVAWDGYFGSQHEPAPAETTTNTPPGLYQAWAEAYRSGAGDPAAVGRGFGRIAQQWPALTSREDRRRAVEHRLATPHFPTALRVAVQDAGTGRTVAMGPDDGFPLVDVVSASGAVPGISPSVALGGRVYVDGGMVSSTNTSLAEGCDEVLVIAPLSEGHGGLPSAAGELAALASPRVRWLVVPDAGSREAVGPNIYDATRRGACADAGRAQGLAEGAALLARHPSWGHPMN